MIKRILETEYNEAYDRIYNLINRSENAIDPDSPEGEEIELLSMLVEKLEDVNGMRLFPG